VEPKPPEEGRCGKQVVDGRLLELQYGGDRTNAQSLAGETRYLPPVDDQSQPSARPAPKQKTQHSGWVKSFKIHGRDRDRTDDLYRFKVLCNLYLVGSSLFLFFLSDAGLRYSAEN
jgi:hypothetical protein